jgi:hypothetical protein
MRSIERALAELLGVLAAGFLGFFVMLAYMVLSPGGLQQVRGIKPDLTTFGKYRSRSRRSSW